MGKQPRRSFKPSKSSYAAEPLQLLHTDVLGPVTPASRGGNRYLLTVMDDHSGYSLVMPLKQKSEVAAALQRSIAFLETQTGRRVRAVRSDNGGEYVGAALAAFFQERGIEHQRTAPYTPEQNGAAERLNRTLLERARAMLIDARMEGSWWAEAVVTACYIRNRCPTHGRSKTPWELLMGSKPDISHMRVFGCAAWVHVPRAQRRKFEPVSKRGVLVGYFSKAYRVWMPESDRIMVTAAVVFDETPRAAEQAAAPDTAQQQQLLVWPSQLGIAAPAPPPAAPGVDAAAEPAAEPVQGEGVGGVGAVDSAGDDEVSDGGFESLDDADAAGEVAAGGVAAPAAAPADAPAAPAQRGGDGGRGRRAAQRGGAAAAEPPAPAEQQEDWDGPRTRSGRPHKPPGEWWTVQSSGGPSGGHARLAAVEPASYAEAVATGDPRWQQAMDEELLSLLANDTWELVSEGDVPPGRKVIPVKWVFKRKPSASGEPERFKARLVAKGFVQQEGVDFFEVYAPVSKHATMRVLFSLATAEGWGMRQLDVRTAFLNGEIEEELYVQQPPGFSLGKGKVCRLRKALYGLRQAPRAWHTKLSAELQRLGFRASHADPSLFVKRTGGGVHLLVYVDDMILVGNSREELEQVARSIGAMFEVRDLGEPTHFLGMEIVRDQEKGTLRLTQRRAIEELLTKFGMQDCKPNSTPFVAKVQLEPDLENPTDMPYRELVGSLMYLSITTRPDIAQAVGVLARFMANPAESHWSVAKGVLRYLAGSRDLGITYTRGEGDTPVTLVGYSDADHAGDLSTGRSTTGYCFVFCGGVVSWQSKLQKTVAKSTAEAEYMAVSTAASEALWLQQLWRDLGLDAGCTVLHVDNQAALSIVHNPAAAHRTKHIRVHYHFVRECSLMGEVKLVYCRTEDQLADVFTKPLSRDKFMRNIACLGMK
jgi:hypothetical protein